MADLGTHNNGMINVTIDDFDPLINYPDPDAWYTPNPQDHPTWFNESSSVTGSVWNEATYHFTDTPGAQASVNFTGSSIAIYGAATSSSNYTITIDPSLPSPFSQTYTPGSGDNSTRQLLFSNNELVYAQHELMITNNAGSGSGGLTLDMVQVGLEVAAEGATASNTTVQDDDQTISYSGDWTQQSGPNFSGGTSHYTQGPGNSFELNFTGSAIYMYGDQVNDHGPYSIYLNGSSTPYATHTGRSGCGGGYQKYCEKLHGLIAFVGPLPMGQHTLKLENQGPSDGNRTFVDLDYLEYTVPSQYSNQTVQKLNKCPFTNCDGSNTSGGGSGSGSGSGTGTSSSPSSSTSGAALHKAALVGNGGGSMVGNLAFGCLAVGWILRKL